MKYARTSDGWIEHDTRALLDRAPWLGGKVVGSSSVPLICPVAPSKIVCIGRNYQAHAKELGNEVPKEPLLFLKPPSSLIGPGEAVELTPLSKKIEHEAELGVVVGKRLKKAGEAEAAAAIWGLVPVCDVTARDIQKSDPQWTRGKGFDTFCPVGPVILQSNTWQEREVVCRVNGAVKQHGNTRDMIFSVPHLLSYISQCMTLEPGDLIVTGTPEGVGPLAAGDLLEVEISGIDPLRQTVA